MLSRERDFMPEKDIYRCCVWHIMKLAWICAYPCLCAHTCACSAVSICPLPSSLVYRLNASCAVEQWPVRCQGDLSDLRLPASPAWPISLKHNTSLCNLTHIKCLYTSSYILILPPQPTYSNSNTLNITQMLHDTKLCHKYRSQSTTSKNKSKHTCDHDNKSDYNCDFQWRLTAWTRSENNLWTPQLFQLWSGLCKATRLHMFRKCLNK